MAFTPAQLLARARRRYDLERGRLAIRRAAAHKDKLVTADEARTIHAQEAEVADALAVLRKRQRQMPGGVSDKGVAFVAGFEGFRSNPYRDAVGVWTIGYGETKGIGPSSGPWSRELALKRLRTRLDRDYLAPVLAVAKSSKLSLSQNEKDALASLVYNLGPGILAKGRTMGDALRSRDRKRIADAFLVYDKAGGRTLEGLTRRRQAERKLFLS
jgi:lysozyme